jgi:MFS family permease
MVQRISVLKHLRDWLGLEHNILIMLITIFILSMGEELWTRYVPKYLELLGASIWIIAVYGTLKDLLDAVYQYPGGWLADRIGRRISLVLFSLIAIVGYLLYILSRNWELILFGTLFVMAWGSLTLPAIFSIIGDNLPQSRRAIGFSVQSILKRIPIVFAPPLGGWLIATYGLMGGMRMGLAITIVLACASIFFVLQYYKEKPTPVYDTTRFIGIWHTMNIHLKRLLIADCLARWAEGIAEVFVILYLTNIMKINTFKFGWITSIQMLTSILIYIPIAKLSDQVSRKPFILLTFAFFAIFPLILVNASNFFWIITAFVIAGLREIGEPARKALIIDLAQESTRGRTVGMYYLIRGLVVFPASMLGGWLWTINHQLPFYAAFIIGLAGFLTFVIWNQVQKPLPQTF